MFWAVVLISVWLWLLEVPDPQTVPYYGPAVVLFALSAVLELLSEPLYVLAQAHLFLRLKVVAESLGMLAKGSLTVVLIVVAREWGLYVFSAADVRNELKSYALFLQLFLFVMILRYFLFLVGIHSIPGAVLRCLLRPFRGL